MSHRISWTEGQGTPLWYKCAWADAIADDAGQNSLTEKKKKKKKKQKGGDKKKIWKK